MSGMLGLIVVIIAVIAIANIAKKVQDGEISPFMIEKYKRQIPLVVIGALVLLLIANSIVTVPVGQRMVVFNQITKSFRVPLVPGIGFVLPLINERYLYDIRTQENTMSALTHEGQISGDDSIKILSSDSLEMGVDLTILFALNPDELNELHSEVGVDYVRKIIRPTIREVIRSEFAKHEATMAIGKSRGEIQTNLGEQLSAALNKYHITLNDNGVKLRNIVLPPTVVAAIEEKKAAQQEAERMQYILEKEEKEKDRVIIEAEAQAERIHIVNEALASNPNYLKWLAIDKLNDNIKLVISDGQTILDLGSYDDN